MSISRNNKIFLVFFGPPGSGKGTQAEMLEEKINLPAISTGVLLRWEIETGSKLGKIIEPIVMKQGKLVDDKIVGEMITKRLRQKDARPGAIFDGYPRNIKQQHFLFSLLERISERDEMDMRAIFVDISDKEVLRRLGGRRSCSCGETYHIDFNPPKRGGICDECGRKLRIRDDDQKGVIKKRLNIYHKQIKPMLDYFRQRDKLIEINGEQSIKRVQLDIVGALKRVGVVR